MGALSVRRIGLAGNGRYRTEIVGESHYQAALTKIVGGRSRAGHDHQCVALLVPEPKNPHDRNAVGVLIDGMKVGHLSRLDAERFRLRDLDLVPLTCAAKVVGGWRTNQHDSGHFGVKLDLVWPISPAAGG